MRNGVFHAPTPVAVAMTALIAQRLNRAWDAFWCVRPFKGPCNRHPFGDACGG